MALCAPWESHRRRAVLESLTTFGGSSRVTGGSVEGRKTVPLWPCCQGTCSVSEESDICAFSPVFYVQRGELAYALCYVLSSVLTVMCAADGEDSTRTHLMCRGQHVGDMFVPCSNTPPPWPRHACSNCWGRKMGSRHVFSLLSFRYYSHLKKSIPFGRDF